MPHGMKIFPMVLNNTKETFKECRDLSFSSVQTFMSEQASNHQKIIKQKNDTMSVKEL